MPRELAYAHLEMGDRQLPTFVRPSRSSAIRIVNPESNEIIAVRGAATSGETRAARHLSTATTTFNISAPDSSDIPVKINENQEYSMRDESTHQSSSHAFNIYARPFVPEVLAVINRLSSSREINTQPMKQINFNIYTSNYSGSDFIFPIPTRVETPVYASFMLPEADIFTQYEPYFRHQLDAEIQSQKKENDSYALFEHPVTVTPHENGQTLSILVPGLGENSPYVEEDDVIQLRQLSYDTMGNLSGMKDWLHWNRPGSPLVRLSGSAAPGWTNIIYNARVIAVQRKRNLLVIKADGLWEQNMSGNKQATLFYMSTLKYNIQFPVPMDRYFPMQNALTIAQKALWEGNRVKSQQKQVQGGLNASQASSTTPGSDNYSQNIWLQSMLFPTVANCEVQKALNPASFTRLFIDQQLNWEQKKAIESICSQNYGTLPFLISGPPGTGKTKTLVELALQLIKNVDRISHILFCAPSDPAADTIVDRLREQMKPNELFRLNRPTRSFAEVPATVLPYCCTVQGIFHLPRFKQLMSCKIVVTTCRDASLLQYARLTNSALYALEHDLQTSIHPYTPRPSQAELHWTALLIDEAAQAMEPEALIPLAVVAPPLESLKLALEPLFVMAGDQHQLGPRTSLPNSLLKTSLLKRLFERPVYASHPLARGKNGEAPKPLGKTMLPIARPAFANLIRNYRSHPAILAVPSSLFYYDTLEPEATDINRLASWSGWQGKRWPVLFCENNSDDELERDFGGWFNVGEAKLACWYASQLLDTKLVQQKEICIMSPFKAQVLRLRKTIRDKRYGSLWDVDIGPTEAFQGLERGVVILCTTRSKAKFVKSDKEVDWGIVGMPNKMNVALTRAKFGLIVIGKRDILLPDPDWRAFLGFCDRNGLVSKKVPDTILGEPTRLERVLLSREGNNRLETQSRGLSGTVQDDEMWTNGMQAALEAETNDSDGESEQEEK